MKNNYQEKFSNKKAPINKSKLWEQISTDKNFPKKDINNRGYFLLLIPLLIGLLFIGNFLSKAYSTSPTISKTNSDSHPSISRTDKLSTNITKAPFELKKQNDITTIPSNEIITNTTEKPLQTTSQSDSSDSTNSTESAITKISSGFLNQDNSINKESKISPSPNTINREIPSAHTTPTTNVFNNTLNQTTITTTKVDREISTPIKNFNKQDKSAAQKMEAQKVNVISTLSISTPLLTWDNRLLTMSKIKVAQNTATTNPSWTIGVIAGYGITNHSLENLSPNTMGEFNATQLRIDNTTNLETQFINVSLSKSIPRGIKLSLEGGLENAYQRFNYIHTQTVIERNVNFEEGFYSRVTTGNDYELFHKYQFVNLNFIVSKMVRFKNFNFSIGAGIRYDASFSIKGKILDKSYTTQMLSDLEEYRDQTTISYLGNIEASYNLTEHVGLVSQFRLGTNRTLTNNNRVFNHTIKTNSLSLGVLFSF